MLNYITNLLNSQRIFRVLIALFLFSLFFPIRHVFFNNYSYLTGQYSDFTSFSLYLSDILFLLLLFFAILSNFALFKAKFGRKSIVNGHWLIVLLLFWLILNLFYQRPISGLNIYFFAKWIEFAIVAYGTAAALAASNRLRVTGDKSWILKFFLLFTSIQSVLALIQFTKQASLGLYRLGESHIGPGLDGVAKLVVDGERYIRGYGTFPHPNVLAAFLLVGILVSAFLFFQNSSKKQQLIYGIVIFINILGLTATFSRAAFLSLGVGLLIYLGWMLIKRINNKGLFWVFFTLFLSISISLIIFRPYLITRATISDQAVIERTEYNQIALKMIKSNPLLGVGIGESVLHMQQYSPKPLEPWQKQPIHNYFLLSAAELGLPGALILIWIFVKSVVCSMYQVLRKDNPHATYYLLHATLLVCFLLLMLFDHYFYTLQQTQLLLWITLGIIAATKNHRTAGGPSNN